MLAAIPLSDSHRCGLREFMNEDAREQASFTFISTKNQKSFAQR